MKKSTRELAKAEPPGDLMPIYVLDCGEHEREVFYFPREIPEEFTCPACGAPARKKISSFEWRWKDSKTRADMSHSGSSQIREG